MALRVDPQPNSFGARIDGVDLNTATAVSTHSGQDSGALFERLRDLWLRYQVLVFPDQNLDEDGLVRVTQAFGPCGSEPYLTPSQRHPRVVEIRRARNEAASPFGVSWHSDWSFKAQPPAATLLLSKVVPPRGGDTWFADGFRAYDALPAEEQCTLEGLTAIHSARRSYSPTGYFATDQAPRAMAIKTDPSAYATQTHPVVRTHPESGRKALWINGVYTVGIRELPGPRGDALIERLCRHATQPEYVYQHRWEANMLVIWDNRSVQHCATAGYDGYERVMHRTTTAGSVPR
ncbi:MAG: TauD/TfdA family dioxygenase [Pseudomonadota bacterium]